MYRNNGTEQVTSDSLEEHKITYATVEKYVYSSS